MSTALDIARECLPGYSDDDLEIIIWEFTGYPAFWRIPEDGDTPEACMRKQLAVFLAGTKEGTCRNSTN